jgi:hypothetical protein
VAAKAAPTTARIIFELGPTRQDEVCRQPRQSGNLTGLANLNVERDFPGPSMTREAHDVPTILFAQGLDQVFAGRTILQGPELDCGL